MIRYRKEFPLVLIILAAVIVSLGMASPSDKLAYSVQGSPETSKDIKAYASDQNINLDTAAYQLLLQESAGNLDAELSTKEEETYAGLWIQHSPQFRIIVQFTHEGKEKIKPYIEDQILIDYVETRLAKYTVKELKAAQVATVLEMRNIKIPTDSGINVVENRVELYVVERSQFADATRDTKIQLPPQTKVITVGELSTQEGDIYAGLRISASNQADCTSGFSVMNQSGVKGILTAAHCDNVMSYNGINLPFEGSAFGGNYDFQWHTAPGFEVRNLVYDGTNNRYVFSTKHRDNQVIGE